MPVKSAKIQRVAADQIRLDRGGNDILDELLLKLGLDLCVPIAEKELGKIAEEESSRD